MGILKRLERRILRDTCGILKGLLYEFLGIEIGFRRDFRKNWGKEERERKIDDN